MKRLLNSVSSAEHALSIWTVYENAKDVPAYKYCARRYIVADGGVSFTDELLVSNELREIRTEMAARQLFRMARSPHDDPAIVEVWL